MLLVALLRWARLTLLVGLVTTQGACAAFNEVITGRALQCEAAPEQDCIRAVEFAERLRASELKQFSRPIVTVKVGANICSRPKPRGWLRCWNVEFLSNDEGLGVALVERLDGTFRERGG